MGVSPGCPALLSAGSGQEVVALGRHVARQTATWDLVARGASRGGRSWQVFTPSWHAADCEAALWKAAGGTGEPSASVHPLAPQSSCPSDIRWPLPTTILRPDTHLPPPHLGRRPHASQSDHSLSPPLTHNALPQHEPHAPHRTVTGLPRRSLHSAWKCVPQEAAGAGGPPSSIPQLWPIALLLSHTKAPLPPQGHHNTVRKCAHLIDR